MKDISIIGATSHLGVHLVDHLAETGRSISATYRCAERVPESWTASQLVDAVLLDLSEDSEIRSLHAEHVIWLAHLDQGRFNERETETNLRPLERFLETPADSSVKQVTFVSSGGSVYGEARELPIREDHPRDPLSSYGKAKKAMEDSFLAFGRSSGVRVTIIRPGNIYGFENPLRNSKGIVGAFLDAMSKRTPFTLIHEGRTIRDFVHVDDVCRAISSTIADEQKEKVWNVGTGVPSQISDILDLAVRRSGLEPPEFIHRPNYASDVQANVLSIERITGESGWRPMIDIEAGIERAVKNWMNTITDASNGVAAKQQ